MKLAETMLRNSRPINVLRIVLAILGMIILLFSMQREQYPNIPLYYVHILVPYPGASATEIEKEITQKVENKTKELANITDITSMISDGLSFTRVSYSQSISSQTFTSNFLELQSLVSNIDFPDGTQPAIIDNFTYLDFLPIVNVVIYSTENVDAELNENSVFDAERNLTNISTDDNVLYFTSLINTANRLKTNLEFLNEVSKISTKGLYDKKIRILLDVDKLEEYQMSLSEVNKAIQLTNITIPAGKLTTESMVINLRIEGEAQPLDLLANTIIRKTPSKTIYLRDVADLHYHYNSDDVRMRFNGKNAITLQIYKTQDADSINLVNLVNKELDTFTKHLPENISLETFADTTVNIHNSIRVLTSNALIGFLCLCLSLLLFLGWKPALISALEIPFTFAISFFVLHLLGITINTSTLFALVLVLGMVVDHGIVILENIIRLRHFNNLNRFDSVVQGVRGVGIPVIASTLTTIGTFIPLMFMPGLIGNFLFPVPVTITVTLIISTVSALIIIPIHYMKLPGNDSTHELKIFDWGRMFLSYILDKVLHRRVITCLLSLAIAGISIVSFFYLPVSLYDTEDQPFFFVDVNMPIGSSMNISEKIMKNLETAVLPLVKDKTIKNFVTAIGDTNLDPATGIRFDKPHNAQLQIEVYTEDMGEDIFNKIIKKVKEKIVSVEGNYRYNIRKQRTGPPVSPAVGFKILGDNLEQLQLIENRIMTQLRQYKELYNIKSNLEIDKPEILLRVDEEKAAAHELTVASIGHMTRQWLSNDEITTLFINNVKIDVVASVNEGLANDDLEKLSYISFPSPITGKLVSFDQVASLETYKTMNSIYRENGKRVIKITADSDVRDRIRQINEEIESIFNKDLAQKYPDAILQIGGEFDEFSNLLDDILLLLVIGIFVVYIILVAEFKSYLQPLLIMLTILFTTIGVSFYLLISQSTLSIAILYSFVALVGVVVNGAIVLVSTANKICIVDQLTHIDAIKKATLQRFKPILLTSFTTIFGVLPTALGISGKSPIWQPMAATIVVGLLFSAMTTLVIIPVFYALLPDHGKNTKKQLEC